MAISPGRTPSAFGRLLKGWRLQRGLTQEELAGKAGVSARLISDLERGVVRHPRRDTAGMLAAALALDGDERERFLAARRTDSFPDPPNVPAGSASAHGLIGRERETAALRDLLTRERRRLVTITGTGGVGKTTLAAAVAAGVTAAFPGGVATAELAALRDDALVLPAIAAAFAVGEIPDDALVGAIAAAVGDSPTLLVLDNLEHLAGAGVIVAELLSGVPGLAILATSREPLRLRDEIEYPLAPLPVPELRRLPPIDELAAVPAVALLLRCAEAAGPALVLDQTNARAVSEIVTRLDGVPLAIELAAARLRSLTPRDLADRLERRLPLLTRGPRDLPDRQRTMAATIDWSYRLLPEEEQLVFRRFSVFAGGARLTAAEAVCGEGLPPGAAYDALHSLTEKHLLGIVPNAVETRYRMLETVREFGLERLAASGDEERARGAHARWCVDVAERSQQGTTGPDQERWFRELTTDHDNLRAALRWAIGVADADTAHAITGSLIRFWMTCGHLREARRWYEAALALDPAAVTLRHGLALLGYGVVVCFQGEYDLAREQTERARAIFTELGNEREIGSSFGNLGLIADLQRRYDEAIDHYRRALDRFRAVGEETQSGYMLHNMGMIAFDRRDFARAEALFGEVLALYRRLDDMGSIAHSLSSLGQLACARGDYPHARQLQIEALELREAIGDESGIAKCIACLAEVAALEGDAAGAAWLLGAAETIRSELGTAIHPADLPAYQRTVERARALLGRRAFAHVFSAGEQADRELAMTVAVGDRPVPVASA